MTVIFTFKRYIPTRKNERLIGVHQVSLKMGVVSNSMPANANTMQVT